jgi:hypothetical protein
MQLSPASLTPPLFDLNIFLGTFFSNTFSLCSSLNLRKQVSNPYKRTGKNYIPAYVIVDKKTTDKIFWTA